MLYHVPDFISLRLIPGILVITCVNNENVSFFYFNPVCNVFLCINPVVFRDVAEVYDDSGPNKVIQRQAGDILAMGAEVKRPVKMGPYVV